MDFSEARDHVMRIFARARDDAATKLGQSLNWHYEPIDFRQLGSTGLARFVVDQHNAAMLVYEIIETMRAAELPDGLTFELDQEPGPKPAVLVHFKFE